MTIIQPSDSPDPLGPAGLGNVPTLGGDVTTAVPDPVTGVSSVQTQQSSNTSTQATAQAIVIPPPPYQVLSRLDPSGSLAVWFQTLSRKLGGYATVYLSEAVVTAPITGNGTSTSPLAMAAATGTVPGYLTAADWTTFNGKVPATRAINTTAPMEGGGDLSEDRTLSMPVATAVASGYLASADWVTFNGKYTPSTDLLAAKFGCNGTAAQGKYTVNVAATDPATTMALVNQLRLALIANGICV